MINDSQARAILLKFDDDAPIVQGMQALAKALSNYGYPNGWITPDNNWFNVATAPGANGQCINVVGLSTHPVPGGTCAFTYHTPEQGIAHAMELWIPRSSNNSINDDSKAFIEALLNGDTDAVVKFAIQRVWGIGPREASIVALGPMAAWTLGSDFYNSAAAIAKALGEPLYFKMPSLGSLPIQIVPLPIQLVPVPLPSGKFPGGGTHPGAGPLPQPNQPQPEQPPPAAPSTSGVNLKPWGALAVVLLIAAGAAKVLK